MKVGDLVAIKKSWSGYALDANDGKEFLGVIEGFSQDLEIDHNLEYKWQVHIVLTDGRPCWAFEEDVEVISGDR